MVLWKKESSKPTAFYINFLADKSPDDFSFKIDKMMCENSNQKSIGKSTELRVLGNRRFKEKKWYDAMELYNQSLRYATAESDNISLAYANRSVCFLQLQKYDQCLADIELAKKANYPQNLMHKLVERETNCKRLMSEEPPKPANAAKLALSFDTNAKFPSLANAVKVQNNKKFGTHIVATRDIDVGQIILIEELLFTSTHCSTIAFCKTCLKSLRTFVPCPKCTEFLFCDGECMESNVIHQMSCSVLHDQEKFDSVRIVESILIAVGAFPSIDDLTKFVESALATPDFDIPACRSDVQTKYKIFLKLKMTSSEVSAEMKTRVFWSYQMLLDMANIKRRIQSKRDKRFLMHLILHHHLIMINNGTLYHDKDEDGNKIYECSGTGIYQSLFDHACVPNASFARCGNQAFVFTIRSVKKGDRLTIVNGKSPMSNQCKCTSCKPIWKDLADRDRFQLEPDFLTIMEYDYSHLEDTETRHMLMEKMTNLLRMYSRSPYMPEFECIAMLYEAAIVAEYSN